MTFQLPATYYDPPDDEGAGCPLDDHRSCSEWECETAAAEAAEDDALANAEARAEYERDEHYDRH